MFWLVGLYLKVGLVLYVVGAVLFLWWWNDPEVILGMFLYTTRFGMAAAVVSLVAAYPLLAWGGLSAVGWGLDALMSYQEAKRQMDAHRAQQRKASAHAGARGQARRQ